MTMPTIKLKVMRPGIKAIEIDEGEQPISEEEIQAFPAGMGHPEAGDQIAIQEKTYTVMLRRWVDPQKDGSWEYAIYVKLSPKRPTS